VEIYPSELDGSEVRIMSQMGPLGGKSRRVLSSNQGTMVGAEPTTCRVLKRVESAPNFLHMGRGAKHRTVPCHSNMSESMKPQKVRKRNLSRNAAPSAKPVKRRIIAKTDGVTDHACKLAKSHGLTEKVGVTGRGIPIRRVLSEIHEFLPGSRIRSSRLQGEQTTI